MSQLAQAVQAKPEQVALAIRASQPALSLTPVAEVKGGREVDIPVESPEEELADRISLQEVLATLPPQDRQLIFLLRQDPERDRKGTGDHTGADLPQRTENLTESAGAAAAGEGFQEALGWGSEIFGIFLSKTLAF